MASTNVCRQGMPCLPKFFFENKIEFTIPGRTIKSAPCARPEFPAKRSSLCTAVATRTPKTRGTSLFRRDHAASDQVGSEQLLLVVRIQKPVLGYQIFLDTMQPTKGKVYQITTTLPNGHKLFQVTIKSTIIFHSKPLKNLPKLGFLV
jgi:hypothetical protein